jgi:peptidyl-prolyl cis-trans isomerase SurA
MSAPLLRSRFQRRILVVAALTSVLAAAGAAGAAEVVNRVVLRVNDRIATLYDYQQLLADRLRQIRTQPAIPAAERERLVDEAPKMVMKETLDELLILSRADQLGIVPSDLEIEDAVGRMRERAGITSDEEFRLALESQGMTTDELRENVRRQLAWDEVIGREILPRIEVSDDDLRRYYDDHPEEFQVPEKIQVEEIVVLAEQTPVPDVVDALAREIHARLEAGESLETVADAYGEAVSSVIDVGWVARGDLAPVLEEALWPLEAGELSEPIAGRGGLHIARILDRSEQTIQPLEDVKDDIRRRERQRLYAEEAEAYLLELEEKALIVGDVPEEAADFRRVSGRPLLADQYEFFDAPGEEERDDGPIGIETVEPESSVDTP